MSPMPALDMELCHPHVLIGNTIESEAKHSDEMYKTLLGIRRISCRDC